MAVGGDNRWGYIDRTGKVVIAPQFQEAKAFEDGFASVVIPTWIYGYIDRTGRIVWQRD